MNAQERLDVVKEWFSEEVRLMAALRSEAVVRAFARDANQRSHVFYRWINEAPLVLLAAIVVLVVVKPF